MTAQSGLHTRPPSVAVAKETLAAIVQDAYGAAPEDVLRLEEIERPTIGEPEVLGRVRAPSVDRGTWHLTAGLPYLIRLAGFGVRRPKYSNPGHALAGTIEAVGSDVAGLEPDDEVFGICDGSFSEYGRVRSSPPSSTGPSRSARCRPRSAICWTGAREARSS